MAMKNWKNITIKPATKIMEAIKKIDSGSVQIVLVVDEDQRLLGTVTDGDVRRGILKGVALTDRVVQIMNDRPTVAKASDNKEVVLTLMSRKKLRQIPIVDDANRVVGLEILDEILEPHCRDNLVVLMAGGLGSRLKPLTDDCPKPLLKICGKPILESILENLIEYGFSRFSMAVNYKANMVEDHFGDGSNWGVEISYIREKKPLGTAGALRFVPETEKPIIVMNGDVLTKINFQLLVDFHEEHKPAATMCVREYNLQVPYGVAQIDNQQLIGIDEKPIQRFLVSAGIYILEPEVLSLIPANRVFDMPTLFQKLAEQKSRVSVFPVREYWLDIGHMDDLERANGDFSKELI